MELRLAGCARAAGADIAQDFDDLDGDRPAIEKLHKDDGYGLREAMAAHSLAQHQLRARERGGRDQGWMKRCVAAGRVSVPMASVPRRMCVAFGCNAEAALAEGGDLLPWLRQAADAAKQSILLSPMPSSRWCCACRVAAAHRPS